MESCLISIIELTIIVLMYIRWPRYGQAVWHCLTRYSTLRACDIDFHDKARSTLTSILMRRSIRLGRAVYQNFEVISVFSVLLFVAFVVNMFIGLATCIQLVFALF